MLVLGRRPLPLQSRISIVLVVVLVVDDGRTVQQVIEDRPLDGKQFAVVVFFFFCEEVVVVLLLLTVLLMMRRS